MAFTVDIQPLLDSISKLSDAERVQFNQLIFKEYVMGGDITRFHAIETGIKCKDPIPYADGGNRWDLGKNAASLTSQCDEITTSISVPTSTKTWDTGTYTEAVEFCYSQIECALKDFMNSDRCNSNDAIGTQYFDFLLDLMGGYLVNSHWVKTYFAAKSSTNEALNGHDGLFAQYLAIATVGSSQRVVIAENAGADYATQSALGLETGFNTYNAMYQAMVQDRVLSRKSGLYIKSTYALANNYLQQLQRDKQLNCCERDTMEARYAVDSLNIYGIPIIIVDEWDQIITAVDEVVGSPTFGQPVFSELNTGTAWVNPHRAVLTYRENEPIGTCDSEELTDLDIKYNEYTGFTKAKMKYDFDAKVIRDSDFILAM